jgi:hypothetical protein
VWRLPVTPHVPRLRIVAASKADGLPCGIGADRDWLAFALLVVGLVPLAGLGLLGRWPPWELGAGAALSLFGLRHLVWPER